MQWIITNGNEYLANSAKPCTTNDIKGCCIFKSEIKADNYLLHNLKNKKAFFGFYVEGVEQAITNGEKLHCTFRPESDRSFDNTIGEFNNSVKNMHNLKMYLSNRISYYDIMQSEFYHLFENGRFPAHIRAKLDKKFDECLRERRKYKIQYAKLLSINSSLLNRGLDIEIDDNLRGNGKFNPSILVDEFNEYDRYLLK